MAKHVKSDIMNKVRELRNKHPDLPEKLAALAERNKLLTGVCGFDDVDLAHLIGEFPNQSLVHRVLLNLGWRKRQVSVGRERGPIWVKQEGV